MQNKYSSGGVLLNDKNEVFLIHKISRNEWSLPKGTVEEKERVFETAFREIGEETGYKNLRALSENPIYISHYNFLDPNTNQENNKYVSYYVFKTTEDLKEKTKEMGVEGLEGEWFDFPNAINIVTFDEAKEVLIKAQKLLNQEPIEIFLLGGNGIRNLDWIKTAAQEFEPKFKNQQIIFYNHWTQIEKLSIDIDFEAQKLSQLAKNSKEFIVFAKSAGIMATLKAIRDYGLNPKKCVFVGFPISFLIDYIPDIESYLVNLKFPTFIYQNSNDPLAKFSEVKQLVEDIKNPNISVLEEIGDTHEYNNFQIYLNNLL